MNIHMTNNKHVKTIKHEHEQQLKANLNPKPQSKLAKMEFSKDLKYYYDKNRMQQLRKKKINQWIFIAGKADTDQKSREQAIKHIRNYMYYHNFLHIAKEIIISIFIALLVYMPWTATSAYVNNVFSIPKLSATGIVHLEILAQGLYTLSSGIILLGIWSILHLKWKNVPYYKPNMYEYLKKNYPIVKEYFKDTYQG